MTREGDYSLSAFAQRLTVLSGPFGVGKTEIAINLTLRLAELGAEPVLVDLDVVTPYFRPREFRAQLEDGGVRLVAPTGEAAHTDLPAVPGGLTDVLGRGARGESTVVVDLGGDGAGAQVLGSLRGALTDGDQWGILFVLNPYRPDSSSAAEITRVRRAVEEACGGRVTGIVANPHLKATTTRDTIASGFARVEAMARELDLPVELVTVPSELAPPPDGLPAPGLELSLKLLLPFERGPEPG